MIRVVVADDEPLIRAGMNLVLSTATDIEVVAEALDGRQAITEVTSRSGSNTRSSRTADARRKVDTLTDGERDVLVLLVTGLTNGDIGGRLHLTEATVRMYVSRVLEKLGCANRVQAAGVAHRAGLEI